MYLKVAIKNKKKDFQEFKNFFLKEKKITNNTLIMFNCFYFQHYLFNFEMNVNFFLKDSIDNFFYLVFLGYSLKITLINNHII